MSWNGSTNVGGTTPAPKKPAKKSPSLAHGLIAGGAIVLIGVISLYFVTSEPDEKQAEKKGPTAISEVTPDLAPQTQSAAKKPVKDKKRIPYWERETTNGLTETQALIWHYHRHPPSVTNNSSQTAAKPQYAIFDHSSENEIAAILTAEPGEGMVGEPPYGESFERDFMKSCEMPIVASDDDDDYRRQLKQDMTQVKIELRQRMSDGEKLGDILRDARHDIQRLAQIKREVEAEVRKSILEKASSSDDIDICIEAANKYLDSKGIAPIKDNPITRHIMERAVIRRVNSADPEAGVN